MRKALTRCFTVLPLTAVVLATCEKPVTTLKTDRKPTPAVVAPRASAASGLPGLQLVKTADTATVSAGSPIGFTLTVRNTGQGTAHNVSLSDPLPGGTGLSWTVRPAVSGCSISVKLLSCSLGDLAAGASASVHVASPTTGRSCALFSNTGSAHADSVGQIQASATTTVRCPGLHVQVAGSGSGGNIGFTITVTNAGPGAALGLLLTSVLPSGAGLSWTVSPAVSGCSISSNNTLTCSLGDLAAFTSVSVSVTSPPTTSCGSFSGSAPKASASGGASVTSDGGTGLSVRCPTGLTVNKLPDAFVVNPGADIGFTITVTVGGPVTARGVTVHDALPMGAGVSWSMSPAVAGCSISSNILQCSLGDLAAGTSVRVHVTSPTTAASCGIYDNTAVASSTIGADTVSARAGEVVLCPPGFTVTKSPDGGFVKAGSNIGFTVTVRNGGAGAATGVTLSDPLPPGPGISWSISPPNPACSITSGMLSCSFGDLASSASASVHVTSPTADAPCAVYNNTVSVQSTNGASGQASASTTVLCPPRLSITKTADAASAKAGNPIGFTVTVTSTGPSTANGVTLSDLLPSGTGISWSVSPSNAACSITSGDLSCNFGNMAPGTRQTVHLTSPTSNGSCGTYNNTATVAAIDFFFGGNVGGSASASTSVTGCVTRR